MEIASPLSPGNLLGRGWSLGQIVIEIGSGDRDSDSNDSGSETESYDEDCLPV